MAGNIEMLLEAERRGILPPERKAALDEARRRGLVPGGDARQPEKRSFMRSVDDFVRSVASGMTFGLADEAAAGMSALTGIGGRGDGSYESNLTAERGRDAEIPASIAIPGQIAGGVATGVGLAKGGATLLNAAKPTYGSMIGRGAVEGAAYGGAHGFGNAEGGVEERAKGAAVGAGIGAVSGGAMGAVGARLAQPKAPTAAALKEAGGKAYKAAEQAGVTINPQSFGAMVDDIAATVKKSGIDKDLHPKAVAALNRLAEAKAAGQPISLDEAEILRRVLGSAAKSKEPDEGRLVGIMMDKLDDYIDNLGAGDVLSGAPEAGKILAQARNLWSRARKGEMVEEMIERAADRAGGQYTGAGYEHALRGEFKAITTSPARLRRFTPQEQQAMRKVVRGGPVENVLRMVGKLAPRGAVSFGVNVGAGAAVGDPLLGGSFAIAGELGRRGATAMTKGNVNRVSDLMRAGGQMSPQQLSQKQQMLIEALLQAEVQQLPALAKRSPLEIVLSDPGNRRTPNPNP
jgi:hypothetical protein